LEDFVPQKFRVATLENPNSRIEFHTSQAAGEPLDFAYLLPVRKAVTRSKRSMRGKVSDVRHPGADVRHPLQHGESLNEVNALIIVVATCHADVCKYQPLVMHFTYNGKKTRCTPDLLLVWGDEIWVVEVIDDEEADLGEVKALFDYIEKLFAQFNINFRLWRVSEIMQQPRLYNATRMIRYQRVQVSPFERESIRRLFQRVPSAPLRDLGDDLGRLVLRLVIDGMLYVDWWQRLTRNSVISVSPIGRQEFPSLRDRRCPERLEA
jgi:hypothetical protein